LQHPPAQRSSVHLYNAIYFLIIFHTLCKQFIKILRFAFWNQTRRLLQWPHLRPRWQRRNRGNDCSKRTFEEGERNRTQSLLRFLATKKLNRPTGQFAARRPTTGAEQGRGWRAPLLNQGRVLGWPRAEEERRRRCHPAGRGPRAGSAVLVRPRTGAVAPGRPRALRPQAGERRHEPHGRPRQGATGLASGPAAAGSSGAGLDALASWPAAARSGGVGLGAGYSGERRRQAAGWGGRTCRASCREWRQRGAEEAASPAAALARDERGADARCERKG